MSDSRRPKRSKYDPVPLYRSYGVTKKETFWTVLNNFLASVLAIALIIVLSVMWLLGAYILISVLGAVGTLAVIVSVLCFVYFKLCRKIRKRLKFVFNLRKRCKQMGYKLVFHRSIFKGLKFNKNGLDFTVNTGKKIFNVRFFTPKKFLCHIIFNNDETVSIKTNITKSQMKFVIGINHPKTKVVEYRFGTPADTTTIKTVNALIINPVPHEVFKKDTDGAIIPIGTGEKLRGYTLFTGSGFLDTLRREDNA